MKYSIVLFLIQILFSMPTAAQEWEITDKPFRETYAYGCNPSESYNLYENCGVIIAFSGLKLRAKPSFDAKTLAVIPFGSQVTRTEHGFDLRPAYDAEWPMTPDSIRGYWQEITWNGKTGYAFSAYIGKAIYRMDREAYLLFPLEENCWNDCFASTSYHYYGVFTNRDSSNWSLKEIKPSFINNDVFFEGTVVRSATTHPPAFIVVTQKTLKEGSIPSAKKETTIYDRNASITAKKKQPMPYSRFYFSIAKSKAADGIETDALILEDPTTGKKQTLVNNLFVSKVQIAWTGDIDNDGVMDFMLWYSSDESSGYQLFISGLAQPKQLMYPVRIYWFGDCC